jgi:hypothetical protein
VAAQDCFFPALVSNTWCSIELAIGLSTGNYSNGRLKTVHRVKAPEGTLNGHPGSLGLFNSTEEGPGAIFKTLHFLCNL